MRLRLSGVLLLVAAAAAIAAPTAAQDSRIVTAPGPLSAGSARVAITPSAPVFLAGGALGRKSTGVHDDLHARCLVIGNGQAVVGLVALDLIGFFRSDVTHVRQRVAGDVDHLIVAATHTHSGPDTLGLWGPSLLHLLPIRSGRDERYMRTLEDRIVQCVREARTHLRPAQLRFSSATVRGFSRNIRRRDIKDDELTVMQVRAASTGDTIAVLYNFAAHPEIFLHETVITADFPFFVNEAVERRFGGVALFVNGAIGGLVTVDLGEQTPGAEETERPVSFEEAARVTARLRDAVLRAVATAGAETTSAAIRLSIEPLDMRVDNWRFRLARCLGVLTRPVQDDRVRTELDALDLGPAQFITVPGEVSPAIGFAIKGHMRGPFRFLVGLGNDELGYILRPEEFRDPLYTYERTMSVGRAAAIVEGEMIRMLETGPTPIGQPPEPGARSWSRPR